MRSMSSYCKETPNVRLSTATTPTTAVQLLQATVVIWALPAQRDNSQQKQLRDARGAAFERAHYSEQRAVNAVPGATKKQGMIVVTLTHPVVEDFVIGVSASTVMY